MADRVKNKHLRLRLYQKEKAEKKKEKRKSRVKRKREREELGDKAPPKQKPKTIESMRVPDETIVNPEDEEVLADERSDEMAAYFDRKQNPKILITTSQKCTLKTIQFLNELEEVIPNSDVHQRTSSDLKKVVCQATEHGFTDVVVINEDRKQPNALILCHLPNGPTAHFKLTSVRCGREIRNHGRRTDHQPEVVLNHFSTRLGHTVGRMLAALFPHDPEFKGRTVITFHNQRDYIFFRHHRYIFRSEKKVGMQELGPRFTLKLRSIQQGTFDSKFGEYIWVHKRKQMDTSRRKFHL